MLIRSRGWSLWRDASMGCGIFATLLVGMVFMALDNFAVSFSAQWFWLAPCLSLILLICEKIFGEIRRIKFAAVLFGLFVAVPAFAFLISPLVIILLMPFSGIPTRLVICFTVCVVGVYVCRRKLQNLTDALTRTGYLSKELKPSGPNLYYMDGDKAKDIDMPMRKYAKKYPDAWLLPVSFGLFALALVVERAMLMATETQAFFLVMALLSTPLAMYVLGEMVVGFSLWILEIHRFEKASCAAVNFHTQGHAVTKEPAVVGVDPKKKKRRGKSKPAASSIEANPGSD